MKRKIIKWGIMLVAGGLVIGGGTAFYLFNLPHRDVQAISADFQLEAQQLVAEYLEDTQAANNKYLAENGESKIISVTGTVAFIDDDMNHQKVVLLKEEGKKAGVSCTFMTTTNINAEKLRSGDLVTIKGVIRSGAEYDEDLDLYEDVILEKCDVI